MKYMLIMNTPRDGYTQYMHWPRKILEANAAFMQQFAKSLRERGELVASEGLTSPEHARLVRAGDGGIPITDGVFPESKEFLAGYWIVDVDSPDRAMALAAELSSAPGGTIRGANGVEVQHFWIEVRGIMSGRQEIG